MTTIQSHRYEFTVKELLAVVSPPLLVLALAAVVLRGGAAAGLLPPPCPALDADRTILLHQATPGPASRNADVALIGDSSCMMDVSALQLGELSDRPRSVVNLGTLSYLDLPAYALILARHSSARATPFRTVVLLVHPEALRRAAPSEYHVETLRHFYNGTDYCGPAVPRILCALGVETFRGRILSRAVPQPLPGELGRDFGFNQDLWDYLSAHNGSAYDPGRFDPAAAEGNAEYRLARSLEGASRAFRAAVPPGVRLVAGITPAPQSFVDRRFPEVRRKLLETWGVWLNADVLLTGLPSVMPDDLFASKTHLNKRGVRLYTEELSRALETHLPP